MTPTGAQTDPFDVRMVFFRVGWMHRYRGITESDTISRGGAYVNEHGFGHEIFNFQPFEDRFYGYVQPPGRNNRWTEGWKEAKINLTQLGYRVDSVEEDNLGWDLDAVSGKRKLKLEVKGLSGSQIAVDLTPNKYAAMHKHRDSYRVCVVTGAFAAPCLAIFAYSPDSGQWESPDRRGLRIQEIVAARCSATPSVGIGPTFPLT